MTLRTLFDDAAAGCPESPAQCFMAGGHWVVRSYGALAKRVYAAAGAAAALGIEPGRDRVALMLENRPEWQEIYLSLACAGVTVVPMDPRLRESEAAHILANAEASVIFAGEQLRELLRHVLTDLPQIRHLVFVDGAGAHGGQCAGRPCWDYETGMRAALAAMAGAREWFDRHLPQPGDVASIIYTSGTTGKPKGAMLTHANFCADVAGTLQAVRFSRCDNFLVVLPLFHAFSFTANFLVPLAAQARMSFARGLKTVGDDMRALHPTVLLTVPLMAEKLYARVAARVRGSVLARLLMRIGLRRVVSRLIVQSLGGRLRLIGVGGAPCPVDLIRGFRRLGLPIVEGYGLTEASPGVSYSDLDVYRPGTVGKALPGIEARIADADAGGVGELLVRGPTVMKGYYRDAAATAEAIEDGWLKTGDLATIDAEGFITIRGRKKALIVNREGKNIYPEEVEQCIERSPYVLDCLVLGYTCAGESGERVGCILVPNLDAIAAARSGARLADGEVDACMRQVVRDACAAISPYKHPRKVVVDREPLERTSTMKVRRHVYAGKLNEQAARPIGER